MMSAAVMTSADAIEGLLALCRAREPILDCTYGSGTFWVGSERTVIGCDINPSRAKYQVADFRSLPFPDAAFPTVIYDPPYHPAVNSAEEERFAALGHNEKEMRVGFEQGLREAWRVSSRHLIVKCQGFVHNHAPQWMPLWTVGVLGEPFEWLIVTREHKRISGRWVSQNSLRRNHADYMLFDKRGNKR
jgi:hypothetical protein